MSTIKFSERIIINQDASAVFDYTQDYANRLKWDSFLKRAELMNGAVAAEKGVKAYCVAKNGLGTETEYITFNRPRATAIRMTRGPWMFKSFLGSWTFKELEFRRTEAIFLYSFELTFPLNLLRPLIRANLRRNVRQRLADLKTCMEAD